MGKSGLYIKIDRRMRRCITLEQLKQMIGEDDVNQEIYRKTVRLEERLNEYSDKKRLRGKGEKQCCT